MGNKLYVENYIVFVSTLLLYLRVRPGTGVPRSSPPSRKTQEVFLGLRVCLYYTVAELMLGNIGRARSPSDELGLLPMVLLITSKNNQHMNLT